MSKATTAAAAPVYHKSALHGAKKYKGDQDLIEALLDDDKVYTIEEVDMLIKDFRLKEVK